MKRDNIHLFYAFHLNETREFLSKYVICMMFFGKSGVFASLWVMDPHFLGVVCSLFTL